MADRRMNALKHSGDSANIAFYSEDSEAPGRIYCEVLHWPFEEVDGKMVGKPLPDYGVTVYRTGEDEPEIGRFTYTPKTKPRRQTLPDRTVTRLVREYLAGLVDTAAEVEG